MLRRRQRNTATRPTAVSATDSVHPSSCYRRCFTCYISSLHNIVAVDVFAYVHRSCCGGGNPTGFPLFQGTWVTDVPFEVAPICADIHHSGGSAGLLMGSSSM